MPQKKLTRKSFLHALAELRVKLAQMDQKLDHLIKTCRKFHFTTDFSDSSQRELNG